MSKSQIPHLEDESIDSYAVRTMAPPPPAARREMIGRYAAEIDRLQRCAVTANLLAKREPTPESFGALSAVVAELQAGLNDLQRRRAVIAPTVRHKDDNTDESFDLGFDAHGYIYKLEALLDVMRNRVQEQSDGHLVTLCEMCIEQLPNLRFALYGEDMGP